MGCSVGVLGMLFCCLFYYMVVGVLFGWLGLCFILLVDLVISVPGRVCWILWFIVFVFYGGWCVLGFGVLGAGWGWG